MPGSKILYAPENNSFRAFFLHLKLRREKMSGRLEKAKRGLDYRTVNKIRYSLEG